MLKFNLLIAIRNLRKNSFYTLVNLFGLTTGITTCLVILLFVQSELSYDKFNLNADRIFRVDWEIFLGKNYFHNAAVTPPMAEIMVRDYPEIEVATRLKYAGSFQFKRQDVNTPERRVVYADNDLFKIFTLPFISGNPNNALAEPNTMVITKACADQFFPNEDALGKTLIQDNKVSYKITGIIEDIPETSHFHYRMFLSMEGLPESKNGNWIGGPYNTYLLLRDGSDSQSLEAKFPAMIEKYITPQASAVFGPTFIEDFKTGGNKLLLHLRPLLNIHLHSNLRNELEANSDIDYIYLFSAIAFFILVIACINFMNLATARSSKRAREVGIRKVLGSTRSSLALQFLAESTILSILSFILALTFTSLLLPSFNILTGTHVTIPWNTIGWGIALLVGALLVGLIAGSYPAFILSSFQPAKVLKGKLSIGQNSLSLRSSLVIFQFFISTFLIIGTFALNEQMNFVQSKKLGFSNEQVILLHDVKNAGQQLLVLRDEILKNSFIINGTISSFFPGPGFARSTPLMWKSGSAPSSDNSLNAEKWKVDYDYIPTMEMEIISGRNFSRDFPSDSSAVILNETAIRKFGFQGNPIGEKISLSHDNPDGSQDKSKVETWTIIGVVKDFNYESLRETVAPLGLFFSTSSRGFLGFRYKSDDTQQVIESLQKNWKAIAPGEQFNYSFLDEDFQRLYTSEKKLGNLFTLFSGLAIVIACLGLFALTAFSAEQRTKEVGIRKVMGASARNIVLLLSSEFYRLILYGFILATPLAWYSIYKYLEQYAYKTQINPLIYPGALILAFLLASLTIGYQSLKVAKANPIDSLRSE